jgi:hypothetical protein
MLLIQRTYIVKGLAVAFFGMLNYNVVQGDDLKRTTSTNNFKWWEEY